MKSRVGPQCVSGMFDCISAFCTPARSETTASDRDANQHCVDARIMGF
jgi:hypothetical protein